MADYLKGYIDFIDTHSNVVRIENFDLEDGNVNDGVYVAKDEETDLRVEVSVKDELCRISWNKTEEFQLDPIENPEGTENLE